MKIGFIGTGVISEAIIQGLLHGHYPLDKVLVSERSQAISSRLAQEFSQVEVYSDNQTIIDDADVLLLAVRPQVAQEVLSKLSFRSDQEVISLIATISHETIQQWAKCPLKIFRSIPLPFVAQGIGVTAIYPYSAISEALFASIGEVVVAKSLDEFDTYAVASATMGTYFGIMNTFSQWMQARGASEQNAQTYLTSLFAGLAATSTQNIQTSFEELRHEHSTPGGLNEQMHQVFTEQGGADALDHAMNSILERLHGVAKSN